jgi:predicted AlkP superfamily phosphohydrolase/phosphomutase
VAPRELARELLAPFTDDEGFGETLISELLPGPQGPRPADAAHDPVLALRWAADIDRRTLDVSEVILKKDPKRSVLAIYLDGFDLIAHAFWQYRFPEDFHDNKPAPADVERLKPVIDRYVQYLDARVGRLLALYATKPDVLIVSDHGHGPTTIDSSWRGWHWSPGMFLMGGPQVPYRANRVRVSYYDVLPTVLDLKRLHHPTGLRGTSVLRKE